MSDLQDLHEEFADQGLAVYGLNVPAFSEDALTVAAFKDQAGLTYPVMSHSGSVWKIDFGGSNTFPYPRDALVGKDGRIAYTSNTYDPGAIRELIAELLAQ